MLSMKHPWNYQKFLLTITSVQANFLRFLIVRCCGNSLMRLKYVSFSFSTALGNTFYGPSKLRSRPKFLSD